MAFITILCHIFFFSFLRLLFYNSIKRNQKYLYSSRQLAKKKKNTLTMPLLRYLDTGTYKVVTMATTQL